jgi:serine/threonine-protein kinase
MGEEKPAEEQVPSNLGKYRLVAELGSGGMARVFLAVMRGRGGFNKLVVLKVPRAQVASDPDRLAMFIDEARIAARLSHPNVVQTFEVIHESTLDIIVMEYLDGYTLSDLIARVHKQKRSPPRALLLKIISEALTGLHYAHSAKDFDGTPLNLVHRDISPQNIFLTFDGQVKLLDFGIAKAETQTHETEVGAFKGKVRYMPREQLAGADMDRRTDIFAVGAMLWEIAVGDRLWRKKSDVEVMSAIIAGEIPSARATNAAVSEALDAIIMKALAADKRDRYSDCLELQREIEDYLAANGDAPSLREIAAYLEDLFAEPRAKRQKIIEEQLKTADLRSDEEPARLPSLAPPSEMQPQSGSGSSGVSSSAYIIAAGTLASPGADAGAPNVALSKKSRATMALMAVLPIVAIAGLIVAFRRTHSGSSILSASAAPPPTSSEPVGPNAFTAAAPASSAQPPGARTDVRVVLVATPPEAKLYFDDEPLASNPYTMKRPKDERSHTLRVESRGYTTRAMTMPLDSDKEIVVSLEKVGAPTTATVFAAPRAQPVARSQGNALPPPATATVTAQPPPPPPTARADTALPTPQGKKSPRTIDTGNPWEK